MKSFIYSFAFVVLTAHLGEVAASKWGNSTKCDENSCTVEIQQIFPKIKAQIGVKFESEDNRPSFYLNDKLFYKSKEGDEKACFKLSQKAEVCLKLDIIKVQPDDGDTNTNVNVCLQGDLKASGESVLYLGNCISLGNNKLVLPPLLEVALILLENLY